MSLVRLLVLIAVVGLVMWLLNVYVPMGEPWKTLLNVAAVIAVIVYLLRFAGFREV